MSTIFISHSSADNALAVELLDWLKTQGYRSVFLDLDPDEGIEAGERWEKVLYRELVSCSVVLALVTETWLASKWCFAEATHARSGGKTILGLSASRGVQPAILADTQSIDYSPDNRTDAYQRLAEALQRAIDPQGLGRWDPSRPLFPGLLFFDERDAPIFFGRRRLGRAIYQKLRELQAKPPGSERLLLVFGPSGSGKSSVVRAGTLPHIHANPDTWITLGPFRPTEGWPEPLRQSMDVLAGPDERNVAAKLREIADQLRGEAKAPRATILLIIDQLEEALDAEDGAESAFWLPLSRLLGPDDTPFMAMATLRSDFMGDFQKRSTRNSVRFGSFPIDPMSPEDLREVIAGPCRVAGIAIGPGLVDVLVEDAGDEQALPLLALALNRLWLRYEAKQGGFTVTDYRGGLGGMRELIDREAESTLAGKGLREASVLDAFLNLTRLVREGVLARQPAVWDALESEARKSLEPFIGARLLVRYSMEEEKSGALGAKGVVVVDLVHETLLSGWKRLHDWLVRPENRDFLPWREELRHKVIRWAQAEERQGLLLERQELKEAKKRLNAKRLALNKQEAAYIQAGIDANKISRVKLAVAATLLAAVAGGWWGWMRSDLYQIRKIENAFPEAMRVGIGSDKSSFGVSSTLPEQLVRIGRADLVIAAADKIDDANALGRVAETLAGAGQADQALAVADKIDNATMKEVAFNRIADALAGTGNAQQALVAVDKIGDSAGRTNALISVAEALVHAGQVQQALTVADKIDGLEKKANVLQSVAKILADIGKTQQAVQALERALVVADKLEDASKKTDVLQLIGRAMVRAGQVQQAVQVSERILAVVDKIDDPLKKTDSLVYVAQGFVRAGQVGQAIQVSKQALISVESIRDGEIRSNVLRSMASDLAEVGQADQALAAADKIGNVNIQASALDFVARNLAAVGQADQALAVLDKINDPEIKAEGLPIVVKALAAAGQADRALVAADKIQPMGTKVYTLMEMAQTLAIGGQTQSAVKALGQALAAAEKIKDTEALERVGVALAGLGQTEQALAAVDKIDGAYSKTIALFGVADGLARAKQIQQAVQVSERALAAVDNIDDRQTKAESIQPMAEALAGAGQAELALTAVDKIDDVGWKNGALSSVAKALAGAGQTEQAVTAAGKLDGAEVTAEAFLQVAEILAHAGQIQQAAHTFELASAAADKIGDSGENAGKKTEVFRSLFDALVRAEPPHQAAEALNQALVATNKIGNAVTKAEVIWLAAKALTELGLVKQAKATLDNARRITGSIAEEQTRSRIYGDIAPNYAQLGEYFLARETAEKSNFVTDTLKAYVGILKYYAIEKNPKLAEKLAKLEKEDKR